MLELDECKALGGNKRVFINSLLQWGRLSNPHPLFIGGFDIPSMLCYTSSAYEKLNESNHTFYFGPDAFSVRRMEKVRREGCVLIR